MDCNDAREALKEMDQLGRGWVKMPDGRVATRKLCLEVIEENDSRSPEDGIEQLRRRGV